MGGEKLPVNRNKFFEEFCCQVVRRKWSRWRERWCQKIFVFIFNERIRNVFICYGSRPGNEGKLMVQEGGEEFPEKYPCGIERDGIQYKSGVWAGSPSIPPKVTGGQAGRV